MVGVPCAALGTRPDDDWLSIAETLEFLPEGGVMRATTTALLAGCLLGTVAVPVVSHEPSPPPWFGGRVETPALSLTIAFPEEWVVFDLTADTDAQVDVVIEEWADALVPYPDALRGDLEWRGAQGQELLALLPRFGMCALDIVPLPASQILDPDFFRDFEGVISADDSVLAFEGIGRIDLPGGPAITYDWSTDAPGTGGLVTRHTGFMIGGEARGAMLACEGWERPNDRWLAIAESFAFLPVEEDTGEDQPRVGQLRESP